MLQPGPYLVLLSVNVIGDNIVYIYKNGTRTMVSDQIQHGNMGTVTFQVIVQLMILYKDDSDNNYVKSGRKFNGGSNPGTYWDTLSIYYLG